MTLRKWALLLLPWPSLAMARVDLEIAFADDSPPYSWRDGSGAARGLLPEILVVMNRHLPGVVLTAKSFPWSRAQARVRSGESDGFLTYPSENRRQYATFAPEALFIQDTGYLVIHREHPQRQALRAARSIADLKSFIVVTTQGSDWEDENIPPALPRLVANNNQIRLNLLLSRRQGDFTVMAPEEVAWFTKGQPMAAWFEMIPAPYLPDTRVSFHFGLRKDHPMAKDLLAGVAGLTAQGAFQKELGDLIRGYPFAR